MESVAPSVAVRSLDRSVETVATIRLVDWSVGFTAPRSLVNSAELQINKNSKFIFFVFQILNLKTYMKTDILTLRENVNFERRINP